MGGAGAPGRVARLVSLVRDVGTSLRRHDLALDSAGVTFYAGIAVVPIALLSLAGASLVLGDARLELLADRVATLVPDTLGARSYTQRLVQAGASLGPVQAAACVLPATLYGEGLLRAFDGLTQEEAGRVPRGWRGRLLALPVVGGAPAFGIATVVVGSAVRQGLEDRSAPVLVGVYVAFLLIWVQLSVVLLFTYRILARRPVQRRALWWGALGTASVVAGFLLGFVLFLSLDLPLGTPFGGFFVVGLLVAVALWGFLLHLLVLAGWVVTLRLDARDGRPAGPVVSLGGDADGQTPVVARG